jgi:methylenetetrahydrofolate reductase (NADPH)
MSLREALARGEFVVTSEVGPPKGIDITEMMHAAEMMRSRVHALNVTDNQAAVMRLSTIAACIHLKQAGIDPVLQVTGRDRNRIGIQSDLLGAASFGITTVLALTGDHTTVGDHKQAKPVFDLDSVQILEAVAALNSGVDLAGNELHGTPEFLVGAVVTPDANPIRPQLAKFDKKVRAGAQ